MPDQSSDIIDRVLELQKIDTYRLDDAPVCFNFAFDAKKTSVRWQSPVRICDDGGKLIGFASLWQDSGGGQPVLADIFLFKDSPERLDLQTDARPLYLLADDVTRLYFGADNVHPAWIDIKGFRLVSDLAQLAGHIESIR